MAVMIDPRQTGFVSGKSTVENLFFLTSALGFLLVLLPFQPPPASRKKAYDSVDRSRLLKLVESKSGPHWDWVRLVYGTSNVARGPDCWRPVRAIHRPQGSLTGVTPFSQALFDLFLDEPIKAINAPTLDCREIGLPGRGDRGMAGRRFGLHRRHLPPRRIVF